MVQGSGRGLLSSGCRRIRRQGHRRGGSGAFDGRRPRTSVQYRIPRHEGAAAKDFNLTKELLEELQEIREIYGFIHKKFINTPEGLGLMREKFINGIFGYCPRMLCNKQIVLPVGLSEDMRYSQVKVFCPLCQEVYKPRDIFYGYSDKKIIKFDLPDGVFFGTSFPQTFLMHFPDLDPRINAPLRYIPKLYGFKIFGKYGSKYYSENKEELKKNLIKFKIINN